MFVRHAQVSWVVEVSDLPGDEELRPAVDKIAWRGSRMFVAQGTALSKV